MSTPRTVKLQARALAAAENISYTEALRRVFARGATTSGPAAGHEAAGALGRLQPHLDDDTVENIIVSDTENVWLEKTDGTLVRAEPVVDVDDDLLIDLARMAGRGTLEVLTRFGMVSTLQASFLEAAVLAGKSIVISGASDTGKTTLLRALCATIPAGKRIGVIEETPELNLPQSGAVKVYTIAADPGSGEVGSDGRRPGEITLEDAVLHAFRLDITHQVVGEVRGREVWAMIKAIESGMASMTTTHAADGVAAIRKLVICAMEAGKQVTADLATYEVAQTFDLIVHLHAEDTPRDSDGGHRHRWVSEILHVAPSSETGRGYVTTRVFAPNPAGGPALPGTLPDELRALERDGFNLAGYLKHS